MALAIIIVWYVSIGALAAAGSMYLTHRFVPARHEATLYGLFLIAIAAFYLACTSYFGGAAAWSLETVAVFAFAVMGCLGTRVPVALIAGYALHGGWDLLHEVQAHMAGGRLRRKGSDKDSSRLWRILCNVRLGHGRVFHVSAPPLGRCLEITSVIMRGGAAKVSLGELRAPPPNSALPTGEPPISVSGPS